MNRKIYINKENIVGFEIYPQKYVCQIYPIHFERKTFLGIFTTRNEETRYATCKNATYDRTYKSPKEIIRSESEYINGKFYYGDNKNAFYFDEKEQTLYRKAFGIITISNKGNFVKFFNNEKEISEYTDEIGIKRNLFGLEFD